MGLTLSCDPGESIRIGEDIVVRITSIKGRSTRLNITAPAEVAITKARRPPSVDNFKTPVDQRD